MPTLVEQLYSQTHWGDIDGVTTTWNFSFSGGYIATDHVKAYYLDALGDRVEISINEDMLIGEFQLEIIPEVPASATRLVIYRNTPKDLPLVDFENGARVTERNLDELAKQAIFVAAEVLDGASATTVSMADILARIASLEAGGPGNAVVGPDGATDGRLAVFDGITGRLLKEGPDIGAIGVGDGDKGDISVTAGVWTIDEAVLSAFSRTLTAQTAAADWRTALGLGSAAVLPVDTDGTLAGNSDGAVPSQKAVKTYVDAASGSAGLNRGLLIDAINVPTLL